MGTTRSTRAAASSPQVVCSIGAIRQRLAARRIAALLAESVDAEGVTNEQSVFYQLYNLGRTGPRRTGSTTVAWQSRASPGASTEWQVPDLRHAARRDLRDARGYGPQFGPRDPRDDRRICRHRGAQAEAQGRFAAFDAGFAFGRTGWGKSEPSRTRSPGRHGSDPSRVPRSPRPWRRHPLWIRAAARRRSRPLYDDNDRWREFAISRAAHNVVTVDDASYAGSASATLASAVTARTHDDITIVDPGYKGVALRRRIVFSHGLGWLLSTTARPRRPSGPTGSCGICCRAPIR